jgi:hypothetical protein
MTARPFSHARYCEPRAECSHSFFPEGPIWRDRVSRPGFSILGHPKWKTSVANFCQQCSSAMAFGAWETAR